MFSIYLNDLEEYLIENEVKCLKDIDNLGQNLIGKLFILLYADDTVVLAESHEGLQKALDVFGDYCKLWKFQVNTNKS